MRRLEKKMIAVLSFLFFSRCCSSSSSSFFLFPLSSHVYTFERLDTKRKIKFQNNDHTIAVLDYIACCDWRLETFYFQENINAACLKEYSMAFRSREY
jgi:hypothetical protein